MGRQTRTHTQGAHVRVHTRDIDALCACVWMCVDVYVCVLLTALGPVCVRVCVHVCA
jgi:hypothetical protein